MADEGSAFNAIESLLGDRYTREARLAPAFLCFFPVLLLLVVWFANLQGIIPGLLAILCVFGVVRWVSHIARGIGDTMEIGLFRKWGGKPTTTLLRFNPKAAIGKGRNKERFAEFLFEGGQRATVEYWYLGKTGLHLPLEADEFEAEKIPQGLDELYEPLVARMRENSRGSALVFEENISYGFQRNLYALKKFAIACAVGSLIVQVITAAILWKFRARGIAHPSWVALLALAIATIAFLAAILRFVSEESVKLQGFTYARQLIYSAIYTFPTEIKNGAPEKET
jgi:hypothetical protein